MSPSLQAGRRGGRSIIRASATPRSGDAHVGRREVLKFGTTALQLLMASKASALIPGNDDEDEECVAFNIFISLCLGDVSDGTVLSILASEDPRQGSSAFSRAISP